MLADETLELGARAAGALLGIDALYRDESDDEDGLVVVNMDAGGEISRADFASYADAREAFTRLRADSGSLPERDRALYYRQLAESTLAFIDWRTDGLEFTAQLRRFLRVPAEPATERQLDALRAAMHETLTRAGYTGDLPTQCAAWQDRNRVDPAAVPGVLQELLDDAWGRTEERVLMIPADRSDGMRVESVSGVAYNARCDYLQRTIQLNTDPVLTRSALKHLAVHEGYPGHFVQFRLRETMFRSGEAAADGLLSIVNSASSSVFEGIADTGLWMLDWIEGEDDRFLSLLNRYRAGIGTVAAWRLHAGGEPPERVAAWLREHALVGGEGWAANRMGFISAPSRAVLIWSYWWGEKVVRPVWERVRPAGRDRFMRYLYGRMHSNSTVDMFDADSADDHGARRTS
jgi:hypothetical protein